MFDSIIYPILIIIFSLLIVYAILNKKNNDKLNNNIEKFIDYSENQSPLFGSDPNTYTPIANKGSFLGENSTGIAPQDNEDYDRVVTTAQPGQKGAYLHRKGDPIISPQDNGANGMEKNHLGEHPLTEYDMGKYDRPKMEKDLELNIKNNSIITKDFANGDWTTAWTNITNSRACNMMTINITNLRNIQDTCNTLYGTIKFIKDIYDITFVLNENIVAVSQSNKNMSLHIKIYNPYTEGNVKKVHGSITAVVSMFGGNKLLYNFYAFKVYNTNVTGELERVISTKDFNIKEPAEVYDLKTYNTIVNDYKYPSNYIQLTFGTINNIVHDKILSAYADGIKFAIQRVYKSPTDNYITTKLSDPVILKVIEDKTIPNEIKIASFKQDLDVNGLKDYFQPYSTIIYFYKFDKINETYDYQDENMMNIERSSFDFKNNSEDMYEPNIKFNNLNTVRKVNNSIYKIQKITEILSTSLSFVPVIPFSNLYNLL